MPNKLPDVKSWILVAVVAMVATGTLFSPQISAANDANSILLQSTTSTANSGLYDAILPRFTARTGITVRVVAVGTGQALKNARNGDADVLLVHAKSAEQKFVAQGYGVHRHDLMYNDFVIVGPDADPAGLSAATDVSDALRRIAAKQSVFVSRGDNSGTHKKELSLWREAGIAATDASGQWYRETGSGMGATLNVAAGMGAYTLTDRGTWISFGNQRGMRIAFEGADALFNQYGVILVNPERHPHIKAAAGRRFIDWLLSPEGQDAIAGFRLRGQQLFFPNATR